MSRTERITTEDCFTQEQKDFFRSYTKLCKFLVQNPPSLGGYPPFSSEASQLVKLEFDFSEASRISGFKKSQMTRFCDKHHIAQFDFDNPKHRDLLLPEIVALNEPGYLKHLSLHDYGRVMQKKSYIIASFNGDMESLEHGLSVGSTVVAFFASKTSKIISLLSKTLGHKEGISKADVEACPEYWKTIESIGIPREYFTPAAGARANVIRHAYLESGCQRTPFTPSPPHTHHASLFFSHRAFTNFSDPRSQTEYELKLYAERLNRVLTNQVPVFYESSAHENFANLVNSFYASPKTFASEMVNVSRSSVEFLNSENPKAASFIQYSISRLQWEFLNEMQKYSTVSPVDTYDTMNKLCIAAEIPVQNRPLYQQRFLSALASASNTPTQFDEPLQIDQQKLQGLFASLETRLQSQLQEFKDVNAEQHRVFQKALADSNKKFSNALNGVQEQLTDIQRQLAAEQKEKIAQFQEKLREQKKQEKQADIDGYKQFAQGIQALGGALESQTIIDAGTIGIGVAICYAAYEGMAAITATSSLGATLGPYGLAISGFCMIISPFLRQRSQASAAENHNTQLLYQVLAKMAQYHQEQMTFLKSFRQENRDQHQATQLMILKGLNAVFHKFAEQEALQNYFGYRQESTSHQVAFLSSDVRSGFQLVLETPIREAIRAIYSTSTAKEDYPRHQLRLETWLTETTAAPLHNGLNNMQHGSRVVIDHEKLSTALSLDFENPNNIIGLLAGIAQFHMPGEFTHFQTLINPEKWRLCIEAYTFVLLKRNTDMTHADVLQIASAVSEIQKKADEVMRFLSILKDCKKLYETLVEKYDATLAKLHQIIKNKSRELELKYYEDHGIAANAESLLRLDETFDEAQKRQKLDEFLKLCKDHSVIFSATTPSDIYHPDNARNVSEYVFHADLKRPNGPQFNSVYGTTYKYGNDEWKLELMPWRLPTSLKANTLYVREFLGKIEYIVNGMDKPMTIDPAEFNGSLSDLDAVRKDILFIAALKDHITWDAAQFAFGHFKNHFVKLVQPPLTSSLLYRNYASQLALSLKLNQLKLTKKYNVSITNGHNGGGDDPHGYFTQNVDCKYSYALSTTDGSQFTLLNGSNNTLVRDYWRFYTPTSFSYSAEEDLALYLGSFWVASHAENWGVASVLNTISRATFMDIEKRLYTLMQPYRIELAKFLEKDVEFLKTVDELESFSLQLISLMNLLEIRPCQYHQEMIICKSEILDLIEGIRTASPQDSINNLNTLLINTSQSLLAAKELVSALDTVNLDQHTLYSKMTAIIYQLEITKKTVEENVTRSALLETEKTSRESVTSEEGEARVALTQQAEKSFFVAQNAMLGKELATMRDLIVSSAESEEAGYQRGLEIGNSLAISVISVGLHEAGFQDAARLLSGSSANTLNIVIDNELSASEKRGFLQAVSAKVIEVIPRLANAQQITAIVWLTTFSHVQITQSLQSQGVTQALLGNREETTESVTTQVGRNRTPAMFAAPIVPPASQPTRTNSGIQSSM